MKDSATSKLAIVVGIGGVAFGMAALYARYSTPPKAQPDRPATHQVSTETTTQGAANERLVPLTTPDETSPPKPRGPTQADRIAMLEAAHGGDQARVEALFTKGVNLDGTLASAAQSGSVGLVAWLLAHGVSAKEDDDLSVPPLLLADEHDAVTSLLLARGAHEPTLAKAVAAGAPKAVSRLLAKGASANSKSAEGEPVLFIAIRDSDGAKRRVIVDALLRSGADVSTKYEDETPLTLAMTSATLRSGTDDTKVGDRAIDLVAKLVAKGGRITADVLASALGAEEAERPALLDVLLAGTIERSAMVAAATQAADSHDPASLKKLASKGIPWAALDAHTTPPLANAIIGSDVPMVKALLEAGAPMDKMGEDGDTALITAVAAAAGESDDALRVVRVLLDHGASPNKRGHDGRTALFVAAQQGTDALVTLLVSKGAHIDDAVDGMTPMEVADSRGHDGIVKLLKARGAKKRKIAGD